MNGIGSMENTLIVWYDVECRGINDDDAAVGVMDGTRDCWPSGDMVMMPAGVSRFAVLAGYDGENDGEEVWIVLSMVCLVTYCTDIWLVEWVHFMGWNEWSEWSGVSEVSDSEWAIWSEWMDGWMDGWMDRWMNEWMDSGLYVATRALMRSLKTPSSPGGFSVKYCWYFLKSFLSYWVTPGIM